VILVACSAADVTDVNDVTGSSSAADDTSTTSTTTTAVEAARVVPEGFDVVPALVRPPAGEPCEVCLWVADTDELRRRGLMGVTDLGGLDGMAFVYDEPRTTSFTMRNTVMALSIVFYDSDGKYLDAFDMEPCRAEPCPSYPTPTGFTVAVEVPQGELERLEMVPGSRLEVLPLAGHCDTPSSH
jgi:uncharacterized membrane protein (UPF0127 family)